MKALLAELFLPDDHITTRDGSYTKSERAHFKRMAGSIELMANLSSQLYRTFPREHPSKEYRQRLWDWTRRRHYTVSETGSSEKHKLHPAEKKKLQDAGFATIRV